MSRCSRAPPERINAELEKYNRAAGQDGSTWSLDNLMQAALATKARNVKIPLEISYAFELAIAARTEISGYFKQKVGIKDASTLSHEHFTKK